MKRIIAFLILTLCALVEANSGYVEIIDQSGLEILTPSLAERKTAKIALENGLEAYLISDPEANQSSAALAMEVGSWNDDSNYPGIAHFTEHLLFLGSKTYPDESGYERQVLDSGGMFNAYTATDRTVYMFAVNNDSFPLTIAMFSHMFIDPLFTPSGVARELHAVDQEHDKNIENDMKRVWLILKETGNPNHPNSLFSTGNYQTLEAIPPEEVRQWYLKNYSAHRAHLVLYSTLPIEELKAMVVRYFSKIPTKKNSLHPSKETLFSPKQEGHVIVVKPVKDLSNLGIYWELPPQFVHNFADRSDELLSYILGGRHEHSLYCQLKKEGLIEHIDSGTTRLSKDSAIYSIDFKLTHLGVKQFDTIIKRCFQTLNSLKSTGIPPYIFEEMKKMAQVDYEYQSRTSPFHFVAYHAHKLVDEPLKTYPLKTLIPTDYDAKQTRAFLDLFAAQKAVYVLMTPEQICDSASQKKEKWSGAEYRVQKIPAKTLSDWNNIAPYPASVLPKQNPFIPTDLKLINPAKSDPSSDLSDQRVMIASKPKQLYKKEDGALYFWQDCQYHVPEVSYIFNISSPYIDETTRNIVLLDLFRYALDKNLAAIQTYAEAASLIFNLKAINNKLSLTLSGYSEKAPLLLKEILDKVKNFSLTKEQFELYKASLTRLYSNQAKAMPLSQAIALYQNILYNNAPTYREKLSALEKIGYEELIDYGDILFQEGYVEGMLAGNMTETTALDTWEMVLDELSSRPYPKKDHKRKQLLTLSPLQGPYKISAQTQSLGNAAILILQEGAMTFPKKAVQLILGKGLEEDFFDTLRTKQQTAYIAQAKSLEDEGQLLTLFFAQSSTHQGDELIARFELFIEQYVKDFEASISQERFETLRTNLITLFETPPPNLATMAGVLNDLAFNDVADFNKKEKIRAALKTLTFEEFKKDALSFLARKNSRRIAIILTGKQMEEKAFCYEEITPNRLKNIGRYTSCLAN